MAEQGRVRAVDAPGTAPVPLKDVFAFDVQLAIDALESTRVNLVGPDHLERGAEAPQPEAEPEVGLVRVRGREAGDDPPVGGKLARFEIEAEPFDFVRVDEIVARRAVGKVDQPDRDGARDAGLFGPRAVPVAFRALRLAAVVMLVMVVMMVVVTVLLSGKGRMRRAREYRCVVFVVIIHVADRHGARARVHRRCRRQGPLEDGAVWASCPPVLVIRQARRQRTQASAGFGIRLGQLFEDTALVLGLDFGVAVVDEQQRGGIQAEPIEAKDDGGEPIQLAQDVRDVVGENLLPVVEERSQDGRELVELDLAAKVLVLEIVTIFRDFVDLFGAESAPHTV